MKDLILFGIQWSGKWTQAELIQKNHPGVFSYVSTGNIFRALTKGHENALWKYVKERIAAGTLIDDQVTNSLFQAYFYSVLDEKKSMLVDGYPRTIIQLDDIFRLADQEKRTIQGIQFVIPDEVALERMQSRGREDDTEEAMKHRIQQFYDHTVPVIDYFWQHADLIKVDATKSIEEIAEEANNILK